MRLVVFGRGERKALLSLTLGEVEEILSALAYKHEIAIEYGDVEDADRVKRVIDKIEEELKRQGIKITR